MSKNDQDKWEKRAEELFYDLGDNSGRSLGSVLALQRSRALQLGRKMADARAEEIVEAIAAEAANMEREFRDNPIAFDNVAGLRKAVYIARSTISKQRNERLMNAQECRFFNVEPGAIIRSDDDGFDIIPPKPKPEAEAGPLTATEIALGMEDDLHREQCRKAEAAIRADEREKIIERIDAYRQLATESGQRTLVPGLTTARIVVRDAPALKPKTREQVLEEALRNIPCVCPAKFESVTHTYGCPASIARRALEWKPS